MVSQRESGEGCLCFRLQLQHRLGQRKERTGSTDGVGHRTGGSDQSDENDHTRSDHEPLMGEMSPGRANDADDTKRKMEEGR